MSYHLIVELLRYNSLDGLCYRSGSKQKSKGGFKGFTGSAFRKHMEQKASNRKAKQVEKPTLVSPDLLKKQATASSTAEKPSSSADPPQQSVATSHSDTSHNDKIESSILLKLSTQIRQLISRVPTTPSEILEILARKDLDTIVLDNLAKLNALPQSIVDILVNRLVKEDLGSELHESLVYHQRNANNMELLWDYYIRKGSGMLAFAQNKYTSGAYLRHIYDKVQPVYDVQEMKTSDSYLMRTPEYNIIRAVVGNPNVTRSLIDHALSHLRKDRSAYWPALSFPELTREELETVLSRINVYIERSDRFNHDGLYYNGYLLLASYFPNHVKLEMANHILDKVTNMEPVDSDLKNSFLLWMRGTEGLSESFLMKMLNSELNDYDIRINLWKSGRTYSEAIVDKLLEHGVPVFVISDMRDIDLLNKILVSHSDNRNVQFELSENKIIPVKRIYEIVMDQTRIFTGLTRQVEDINITRQRLEEIYATASNFHLTRNVESGSSKTTLQELLKKKIIEMGGDPSKLTLAREEDISDVEKSKMTETDRKFERDKWLDMFRHKYDYDINDPNLKPDFRYWLATEHPSVAKNVL